MLILFATVMAYMIIPMRLPLISNIANKGRWVILGLFCLAGFGYLKRALAARWPGEFRWIALFTLVSLLACLYSIMPLYSFGRWASLVMLLVAVMGGLCGWLQDRRRLLMLGDALMVVVLIVSLVAAVNGIEEGDPDTPADEVETVTLDQRATGAFGKATGAGGFAATAIPLLVWALHYSRGRRRWMLAGCLALQLYLLVFSGARAAIVSAMFGGMILAYAFYPRYLMLTIVVGAGLTIGLGAMVVADMLPRHIVRVESLSNLTGRLDRYQALWHVHLKSPVMGYGYGVSRYMIGRDREALDIFLKGDTVTNASRRFIHAHESGRDLEIHSHSDHLERLVETGWIGYVPFALFWMAMLWRIPAAVRRVRDPANDLVKCLGVVVIYWFVDSFLHSAMLAIGNGTTMWMWVLGMAFVAGDQLVRREYAQWLASAPPPGAHGVMHARQEPHDAPGVLVHG
jgi:O-antigen ligase